MRFISRDRYRLGYDVFGPAKHAAPVLLLHDLLDGGGPLRELAKALAGTQTVLLPDARGHGASATLMNRWYTIGELAQDALAVLDAEEIDRVSVCGVGLGGTTALELTMRDPGRVRALVLIDPDLPNLMENDRSAAALNALNSQRTADRTAADASYKELTDQALDRYLTPRLGADWRARLPPARLGAIRRNAGSLAALLPAVESYRPDRDLMRGLTAPTLIALTAIATDLDQFAAERLTDLLPAAQCLSLPDSDPAVGLPVDDRFVELLGLS